MALTFEFSPGCTDVVQIDGDRVILPCPLHVEDICVQHISNVLFSADPLAEAPNVYWDASTCTMRLTVPPDCRVIDWTKDVSTTAPDPVDCDACSSVARETGSGKLTHICVGGAWYEFPVPPCSAVLWDSSVTTEPAAATCSVANCYALAFDTNRGLITHVCIDGAWESFGSQASVSTDSGNIIVEGSDGGAFLDCAGVNACVTLPDLCDLIAATTFEDRAILSTDKVVVLDEAGNCRVVWFGADHIPANANTDNDTTVRTAGSTFTFNVAGNDTPCPAGEVTTWVPLPGTFMNVSTVTPASSTTGAFNVTVGSTAGAYSYSYEIYCDGNPTGSTATVAGTVVAAPVGPIAVPETDPTTRAPGVAFSFDVGANDTPCPGGQVTTWVALPASYSNVATVTPTTSTNGVFTITPGNGACTYSFQYEMYCDGNPTGQTATVSGNVSANSLGAEKLTAGDFAGLTGGPVGAGVNFGGGWSSSWPYAGYNAPSASDAVSIQNGNKVWNSWEAQVTFPGDTPNGVPAVSTFLYGIGNSAGGTVSFCQQTISVTAGKSYRLVFYSSNSMNVTTQADDPMLQFSINGAGVGPVFREYDHADPAGGDGGVDKWHRRTHDWTAPTTGSVVFGIQNSQTSPNGNGLCVTQISVKEIITC